MRLPVIQGLIDRRILVNFRVDAGVLAAILPPPFRPQMVQGFGMAGICLIRLHRMRPKRLPGWVGISSENAAHRVAVEWDSDGETRSGVYVLRRDTNSRLNALAGGRVFPGVHYHAAFHIRESKNHFDIALRSDDRSTFLHVVADTADAWPADSVFGSQQEASAFFEAGSLGYSRTADGRRLQGLELRCLSWQATPIAIDRVSSSLFGDERHFPRGSVEFDCALLMRGIEHEWYSCEDMCGRHSEVRDRHGLTGVSTSKS
jgi:hypothetical protein